MALYLKMDQKTWAQGDYTDSSTYDLSGTVYRDNTLSTAETSLDTFTGTFRLIDPNNGNVRYSSTVGLTLVSDGTFTMTFAQSSSPSLHGNFNVRLSLEKTDNRLSAIGVHGSDELYLEWD